MIIQCKECGTKYRFDKSQITGEGVWVRCSRCGATFFQKNPLTEISSLVHSLGPEREPPEEVQEGTAWENVYPDAGDDIRIERVEEELAEGIEEGTAGGGPAWEEEPLGVGERMGIEEEVETEGAETAPAGEDTSRDIDTDMEMERAEEEELRTVDEAEAGSAVRETAWEVRLDTGEDAGSAEKGPPWEETYGDIGEIAGVEETPGRQRVREPWTFGDTDEMLSHERIMEKEGRKGAYLSGKKVVLYLVLVVLLAGGISLWLVPDGREMLVNRALPQAKKLLGIAGSGGTERAKEAITPTREEMAETEEKDTADKGVPELKVTLVDVGERFVKGWTGETIMVVEGSAVNDSALAVSHIQVRGKILDSSGTILSEEESHCGTILTDDELKNLTGSEIKGELSNLYGRNFRNADVQPGERIPFMLVFTMPADEASELVVELMDVKTAGGR